MQKLCALIAVMVLVGCTPVAVQNDAAFGFTKEDYNCTLDCPADTDVVWMADEILAGNLYVHEKFMQALPCEKGAWDWNVIFSDSPASYQLQLQALSTLNILARAYELNGNTDYLSYGEAFLESWTDYSNSDEIAENSLVWHDHGTALRAENIMNFALTLEKADMLNQEKILNINSLLKKHAEFLNDEAHYTPDHNHGIFQDCALAYLGYFLSVPESGEWIATAEKRLQSQIDHAFNDELVHVENSPGYHFTVLQLFTDIAQFFQQQNNPFGEILTQDIQKSAGFLAWAYKPNGYTVAFGDSSDNADATPKTSDRWSIFGNSNLDYAATLGKSGTAPQEQSKIYPQSGYYFYHEDWEQPSYTDATWKAFKAGYDSATHKHADDLSFVMYSKGYDIFIDSGWYNYMQGNQYRDYLTSSRAHNTIVVDGKSYSFTDENKEKTGMLKYELGEEYDYVLAFNDMYHGVEIDRHFFSVGDATVLYDNIESEQEHVYSQLFHLSEYMKVLSTGNEEVLLRLADTEYVVRIRQLGEKPNTLTVINGNDAGAEYGYVSHYMNQLSTTNTLKFDFHAAECDIVTLITIEDSEGKIILNKKQQEICSLEDIAYSTAEKILHLADRKLELEERACFTERDVEIDIKGSTLHARSLCERDDLQYAWYLVDASTMRAIYKTEFTDDADFSYNLSSKEPLLIKAYVRSVDVPQKRSSIVASLSYDNDLARYIVDDHQYGELNLQRTGQQMQPLDNTTWKFSVDIGSYILPYSIRWYIYRNGSYYTVAQISNANTFEYDFTEDGDYTVSYYIKTANGDYEFWNFPQLHID